jgi:hypothetical protein
MRNVTEICKDSYSNIISSAFEIVFFSFLPFDFQHTGIPKKKVMTHFMPVFFLESTATLTPDRMKSL